MATLYRWPEAHGLPSVSPACLQVEAYLRMTGVQFTISPCSTNTRSPTGQLPAVEAEGQFSSKAEGSEFAAARTCIDLARTTVKDLDAQLTTAQRAEVLAFASLLEQRLDTATEYSMWAEPSGYKAHVQVAYAHQPFPLNLVMPWGARREALRRLGERDAEQLYSGASTVLSALSDKLRAAHGPYLMGARPCSLDALLFGHLLFYRSSPSAAPTLKAAVTGHGVLQEYVSHILSTFFTTAMPTVWAPGSQPQQQAASSSSGGGAAPAAGGASSSSGPSPSSADWSNAAKGQKKPAKSPELTAAEREFRRKSWWWLGGAAAVTLGYIIFSGRYISMEQLAQVLGSTHEDDDEEDHDDMDGDEGDDE